jgi:hypothetical protein
MLAFGQAIRSFGSSAAVLLSNLECGRDKEDTFEQL